MQSKAIFWKKQQILRFFSFFFFCFAGFFAFDFQLNFRILKIKNFLNALHLLSLLLYGIFMKKPLKINGLPL